MANWNPKVPLNFRTIVFCFLAGMVLSIPAGAVLDSPLAILAPSSKALHYYERFCGFCFMLLPGWICVMCHCRWFTVLFVILFVFLVFGMMMPATV